MPEESARIPLSAADQVQQILSTLRRNTTARGVLLVDEMGQIVAEAGTAARRALHPALPALVEEIRVTRELGTLWDRESTLSLHYYEGAEGQVYAAAGGQFPYLLVVMTRRQGLPPSGVTWLFVRRALQELRSLLRPLAVEPDVGQMLGVVEAGQEQGESERR